MESLGPRRNTGSPNNMNWWLEGTLGSRGGKVVLLVVGECRLVVLSTWIWKVLYLGPLAGIFLV